MKEKNYDYTLYLVTDRKLSSPRSIEEVVLQSIKGGASAVQLREKDTPIREFLELARALKKILSECGVPLIINDRLDVALLSDADGLHLGQEDLPVEEARALLGASKILGLSIDDAFAPLGREIHAAEVDYLAIGPVFPTASKSDAGDAVGLEAVRELRSKTELPIVGIGGITPGNAGSVVTAGASGVAVVSALCAAPHPEREAAEFCAAMRSARSGKESRGTR